MASRTSEKTAAAFSLGFPEESIALTKRQYAKDKKTFLNRGVAYKPECIKPKEQTKSTVEIDDIFEFAEILRVMVS